SGEVRRGVGVQGPKGQPCAFLLDLGEPRAPRRPRQAPDAGQVGRRRNGRLIWHTVRRWHGHWSWTSVSTGWPILARRRFVAATSNGSGSCGSSSDGYSTGESLANAIQVGYAAPGPRSWSFSSVTSCHQLAPKSYS